MRLCLKLRKAAALILSADKAKLDREDAVSVSPNGNGFPLMLSTHSKRDMCTTEIPNLL